MSKENPMILSGLENSGKAEAKKEKIPIPINKCLFLDLDMTLINNDYQITDSRIFGSIRKLQKEGWGIGLNSNTPLKPLLVWMKYFGMRGPLIAEKGLVIRDNKRITFDKKLAKQIQTSRKKIKEHFVGANIQCLLGNPVDIIRENKFGQIHSGPLVLLNTARKCSLNFYVREVTSNGQITINQELTSNLVENVRKYYSGIDNLEEELSHADGVLLAMPKGQTKRIGTLAFMENVGLTQIGIIGDSMNDFFGEDKAVHYAVGNAKEDYKAKAGFVSKFSMTKGCVDILERLRSEFLPGAGGLLDPRRVIKHKIRSFDKTDRRICRIVCTQTSVINKSSCSSSRIGNCGSGNIQSVMYSSRA